MAQPNPGLTLTQMRLILDVLSSDCINKQALADDTGRTKRMITEHFRHIKGKLNGALQGQNVAANAAAAATTAQGAGNNGAAQSVAAHAAGTAAGGSVPLTGAGAGDAGGAGPGAATAATGTATTRPKRKRSKSAYIANADDAVFVDDDEDGREEDAFGA